MVGIPHRQTREIWKDRKMTSSRHGRRNIERMRTKKRPQKAKSKPARETSKRRKERTRAKKGGKRRN